MTITNYGTLKTACADWSTRSGFTNWIPDFILIAEDIFNNGEGEPGEPTFIKPLRVDEMISTGNALAIDANFQATVPTDFLAIKSVRATDPVGSMSYVDPSWWAENYPSGDSGDFVFYTSAGSKIMAGQDMTLDYYQMIPTIVGTADADAADNWLIVKSPRTYLFGSLYALSVFNKSTEKAQLYRTLMAGAIGGLRNANAFRTASAPTMRSSMTAF